MMDIEEGIWNGGEMLGQVSLGRVCQMHWFYLSREIHRARQSPFYVREWHILVLNGINLVPSSTLRVVLLLIISVLSIVVVLDVFLEGNSSNLRVACIAVSFIDHCRAKVISAHCRRA